MVWTSWTTSTTWLARTCWKGTRHTIHQKHCPRIKYIKRTTANILHHRSFNTSNLHGAVYHLCTMPHSFCHEHSARYSHTSQHIWGHTHWSCYQSKSARTYTLRTKDASVANKNTCHDFMNGDPARLHTVQSRQSASLKPRHKNWGSCTSATDSQGSSTRNMSPTKSLPGKESRTR